MNFGGANIQKMMKQAQKMQADMVKTQEKLKEMIVEGTAGGGMVKIKMTAGSQIVDVTIDPEVVDPEDVEMLQDMIMAAFNDAVTKATELSNSEMNKVTGGMNFGMPGLGM